VGLQEVEWAGMDWIDLDEDRDRCQALVNAVMNIWVLKMQRTSSTSFGTLAFRKGFALWS
jgi:hypothetical protein